MTTEQGLKVQAGDVVQIDPAHDPDGFGGCLMLVTEPKSWGVQGFVHIPGADGGDAYYRVKFEWIEWVGRAAWVPAPPAPEGEANG